MRRYDLAAVILILVGALGLAYGGYRYTWEGDRTSIGSLNLSWNEERSVRIPVAVSIGALVIGAGLLFARSGRFSRKL